MGFVTGITFKEEVSRAFHQNSKFSLTSSSLHTGMPETFFILALCKTRNNVNVPGEEMVNCSTRDYCSTRKGKGGPLCTALDWTPGEVAKWKSKMQDSIYGTLPFRGGGARKMGGEQQCMYFYLNRHKCSSEY